MALLFGTSLVAGAVAGIAVGVVVAASGGDVSAHLARGSGFKVLLFVAGLAAGILFHAVCDVFAGGSPGKLALGLRVVTVDGDRIGVGAALLRNVAYYVDGFFFGMPAASAMSASGARNMRYGDQWAKTMVVPAADARMRVHRSALGVLLGVAGGFAVAVVVDAVAGFFTFL